MREPIIEVPVRVFRVLKPDAAAIAALSVAEYEVIEAALASFMPIETIRAARATGHD